MYFFFFLFAIVGVFSAIMVITRTNVMHAALFLLLTFACVGATYVLLRAEVIAAVQVLIYAGAVMVLFIFAILLVNIPRAVRLRQWNRQTGLAVVIAGLTGLWMIIATTQSFQTSARLRLSHSSCWRRWWVRSSWRVRPPWRRRVPEQTSPRQSWWSGHQLAGSLSNSLWMWRTLWFPCLCT